MRVEKLKPGNYVVAVSGGVDSVVLLDFLSKNQDLNLTVAHFNHGMREDADQDALFVKNLAKKYQLPFVSEIVKLGKGASEEKARNARYKFLRKAAKDNDAKLVVAHHQDDVLETIIINLLRGTGWRGLSSLRSTEQTLRPLIKASKQEILGYASKHNLKWREDSTNKDTTYLRNYVRLKILPHFSEKNREKLMKLHYNQLVIFDKINTESKRLLDAWRLPQGRYNRYPFIMADEAVAMELLKSELGATQPQVKMALLAIKTAKPGAQHVVNRDVVLGFSTTTFIVSRTTDMLS